MLMGCTLCALPAAPALSNPLVPPPCAVFMHRVHKLLKHSAHLYEVQVLQRGHHIIRPDAGCLTKLLDADGVRALGQHAQQLAGPVATVRHQAQVTQWPLGCANL